MRGRPLTLRPRLTTKERQALEAWTNDATISDVDVRHARIVLLVAQGMPLSRAAGQVGLSRLHATKWLKRWQAAGIEGLRDKRHERGKAAARRAWAAEEGVRKGRKRA